MAKDDDDLSPEERQWIRDAEWRKAKQEKNKNIDSVDSRRGYHSKKWHGKNKKDEKNG